MFVDCVMDGVTGVEAYASEPGFDVFVPLQVILLFPSAEYSILNNNLTVVMLLKAGFNKCGVLPA